ncbi:hypothetical protein BGX21_009539 [Mortierella sp. AD011]|nr:hypothetical protein BGX20_009820 [Mortierella sp. AD010]KAF9396407.1 hypothetical protein BGX21_009539 [Mortierella sp. AD011]
MEPPLPQPPSSETSQVYNSNAVPHRVGSLLLQATAVTVPTFSAELDLGSIANPQKHSPIKRYLFASLLFKPFIALLLDCFSLAYLSSWIRDSLGKSNSTGFVFYIIATCGAMLIVCYGGWRATQVLKKGHIQAIFVNREAYRWTCLTSYEKFLFFERIGQGYGAMDALVFFTWFTLRAAVAHQQSQIGRGEAPTLNLPEMSGITHVALALNIMLQVCNLFQFLGAIVVLLLVRSGKLVSLRKDEHLHTYCQRNLNVRIVRMYKLAKSPGTRAPLRENDQLEQRMSKYAHAIDSEGGIDISQLASLAWDDTETQDENIDYNHYAYRPRPISTGPPARKKSGDDSERIEMTEKPQEQQQQQQQDWISSSASSLPVPPPPPGSFSYAQWQHLQIQKQKYGDDRSKYEPMQWNPNNLESSENQGQVQPQTQGQSQGQTQSQQDQQNQSQRFSQSYIQNQDQYQGQLGQTQNQQNQNQRNSQIYAQNQEPVQNQRFSQSYIHNHVQYQPPQFQNQQPSQSQYVPPPLAPQNQYRPPPIPPKNF